MSKQVAYIVPKHLEGKEVWTTPPTWRKGKQPGRFILNECSQKDLKYLHSKGIDIKKEDITED